MPIACAGTRRNVIEACTHLVLRSRPSFIIIWPSQTRLRVARKSDDMALQFIANQRVELYKDVQRLRQAYLEALVLTICFPFHVYRLLVIFSSEAFEHLSRVCPNPFRRYVAPFGRPSVQQRIGQSGS